MMQHNKFVPPHDLNTPVLFLVFNRPETTKLVFEEIKKAKPPRLYIAADGPRGDKSGEAEKVKQVREYVMGNVDWDCELRTLFRDENLGCKYAVSSAIDWFFENEEMGIILEDDCLPSQSFFWFCEELLERYKDDERIFIISGYNKQSTWNDEKYDYFFSHFGGIWGWASWRRAWNHYDINMPDIQEFIDIGHFENLLGNKVGIARKKDILNVIREKIDTWDYQWGYARHKNSAMACVPSKSLIENIGFGSDSTHTNGVNNDGVTKHDISFPLDKNNFIVADSVYDENSISNPTIITKFINKFKGVFNAK